MRIMVTGSDGYIGKGVVDLLLRRGHEVIACGLHPCGADRSGVFDVVGDVFCHDFSADLWVPDVLLHLAWRNGFSHGDITHLEDLAGHYEFLKSAIDAGVPRIAVMGTMHEVGYHEGSVDENTPCAPTTPYAVAKNALRQLCEGLCRDAGIPLQWMRGYYLVSADGSGNSIFSKIVRAAVAGQTEFPFTSGKSKYDFLPYQEFCEQVVAIVEQDEVCGIINVCSGEPIALGEYIEQFIADNDLTIRLAYGRYPDRSYDSPAIWGDASKVRKIMTAGGKHR